MNDMTYRKSFTIAMCDRHMLMYVKKNSWKKSVAAKSKKSSSAFLREFRRARIHRNVKKKKKDLTPKKKKRKNRCTQKYKKKKESDLRKLRCFYAFRKLAHEKRDY